MTFTEIEIVMLSMLGIALLGMFLFLVFAKMLIKRHTPTMLKKEQIVDWINKLENGLGNEYLVEVELHDIQLELSVLRRVLNGEV